MKRILIILFLSLLFWNYSAIAEAVNSATVISSENDNAFVFDKPNDSSEPLGWYYPGTNVEILSDIKSDWVKIQIGSVVCYIKSLYLTQDPKIEKTTTAIVSIPKGTMNLREDMSIESRILQRIPKDISVNMLGVLGEWVHVEIDGDIGFMLGEYLDIDRK